MLPELPRNLPKTPYKLQVLNAPSFQELLFELGRLVLLFLNERTKERTRSLQDHYEVTERLVNLTPFCLFADF